MKPSAHRSVPRQSAWTAAFLAVAAAVVVGFLEIFDPAPYEAPENPDVRIDTSELSVEKAVEVLIGRLTADGHV